MKNFLISMAVGLLTFLLFIGAHTLNTKEEGIKTSLFGYPKGVSSTEDIQLSVDEGYQLEEGKQYLYLGENGEVSTFISK